MPLAERRSVWRRRWRSDSGTVTAEFAIVLPAVMVLALLLLTLTQTIRTGMVCQDAANAAARDLIVTRSKGDPQGLVHRMAGPHAQVKLSPSAGQTAVRVSCPVVSGPMGVLPAQVHGDAVAILEE